MTGVDPADGGTDVAVDKNVVVSFSEAMNKTTAQSAFSLTRQGTATKLSGVFTWNAAGTQMTFNPSANLGANTVYEIKVSAAAKDLAGNALGSPFASSFRSDATGAGVTGVDPADGGTDVAVDKNVVVSFSEAMNKTTAQSAFSLTRQGTATKLSGVFTWNAAGTQMTFNPSANLGANTVYEIKVSAAAKDLAGNALGSPFASSFRSDATGAGVTGVDPADGGTDVAVDKNVVVSFSEAMNKTDGAVGVLAYQAGDGDQAVGGLHLEWRAGTQMTFNPSANLGANTVYEI